jgi:hypothetical protein
LVINGEYSDNGTYQVRMRDTGSNGNNAPLTEGASLVIVYQTQNAPFKSVVIYDGAYAMNNSTKTMNVNIKGFYQAQAAPGSADGRLTHIVGDGQLNFTETLFFNDGFLADNPFVGAQGFSWDNPTFNVSVPDDTDHVTTQVLPNSSNLDCLSWGALVFSTPVKDQDADSLLDRWEQNHGYTDIQDGSFVSLPNSHVGSKDLYVQMDFLKNTGTGGEPPHSHLLRQDAINMVGQAFARQSISLHVDVGNRYPASQFIIGGRGGNAIDESSITCTDSTSLCQFPNTQGVVSWKGGVHELKNTNFQNGRKDSYLYFLAGHSLGVASTEWSIAENTLKNISCCEGSGGTQLATVTTASAHGLQPSARVTIAGAVSDWDLDDTYLVDSVTSPTAFKVAVKNVNAGTYGKFPNQLLGVSGTQYQEPSLAVYTGPLTSISGVGDLPGGDFLMTLGLWRADDPAGCQADPTVLGSQTYCDDRVGNTVSQAGTFMHELGHTLMLTHGGIYGKSLGDNCKSNHVSVMNYIFQIRGIPGGVVDFSGQNLPALNETNLNEAQGLGRAIGTNQLPSYGTRWYAPLGFLDSLLQNSAGGRIAKSHCDGSPTQPGEQMVRLETPTVINGQLAPIDWNNNGVLTDIVNSQDINFSGSANGNLAGFNDWATVDLRHIGGRRNVAGFSVGTSSSDILDGGVKIVSGGVKIVSGGADIFSEGVAILGGGVKIVSGGVKIVSGGTEVTFDDANATVEEPGNLAATVGIKQVVLTWNRPSFGQIRTYYIWRAEITKVPISATNPPINIGRVTGTPPVTTFTDTNVKTNATYVYFVSGALGNDSGVNAGNQSGASNLVTITAK